MKTTQPTPQPAGDLHARAEALYVAYTGNHPTIHCNRFPAWRELSNADKREWLDKASPACANPEAPCANADAQPAGDAAVAQAFREAITISGLLIPENISQGILLRANQIQTASPPAAGISDAQVSRAAGVFLESVADHQKGLEVDLFAMRRVLEWYETARAIQAGKGYEPEYQGGDQPERARKYIADWCPEYVQNYVAALAGSQPTPDALGTVITKYLSEGYPSSLQGFGEFAADVIEAYDHGVPAGSQGEEEGIPASFANQFSDLNPATLVLVWNFAVALADKLAQAEKKYGYSDGWRNDDWMDECRSKLVEHVSKGDPRDVAAYCAFLWHHGESTATTPAPAAPDGDDPRIAKLQAFKDYVHQRLDEAGIPSDPGGQHSEAGCRIGDRLDIALSDRRVGEAVGAVNFDGHSILWSVPTGQRPDIGTKLYTAPPAAIPDGMVGPTCSAWAILRPDGVTLHPESVRVGEHGSQWSIGNWSKMKAQGFQCVPVTIAAAPGSAEGGSGG